MRFLRRLDTAHRLGTVLRGAGFVLAIRVAASLLGYVLIVALARTMGSEAYGAYAYAVSWMFLIVMLGGLGLNIAGVRFLPEYASQMAWGHIRGYLGVATSATLASAVLLSLAGCVVLLGVRGDLTPALVPPLAVALLGLPVMAFVSLGSQVARAFGWIGLAYAPSQVLHPVLMIAVLSGSAGFGLTLSARDAVVLSVGAFGLVLLVQAIVMLRLLYPRLSGVEPRYETGTWLRTAAPLLLVDACYALMTYTDMAMIGAQLTPQDAAHYHAAARTAMLVTFFQAAIIALVAPTVAELHSGGRLHDIQRLLKGVMPWTLGPSLATLAVLVLGGQLLLRLFGPGFDSAYPAMIALALGGVFATASGPAAAVLSMTGHQDDAARVLVVAAITNIALNGLLIPVLGISGAALATAAANAGHAMAMSWCVHRRLGLSSSMLVLFRRPEQRAESAPS